MLNVDTYGVKGLPLVLLQTQYCLQHLQQQNWAKEKKRQKACCKFYGTDSYSEVNLE